MRRRNQMFNSTLLAGALVALLATPTLMAQRKGRGGGVKPGNVAAIVRFNDLGTDRIKSDTGEDYAHVDLAPQGGWVNFPGTGNLTIQTRKTDRNIVWDFSGDLGIDLTGKPLGLPPACDIQVDLGRIMVPSAAGKMEILAKYLERRIACGFDASPVTS